MVEGEGFLCAVLLCRSDELDSIGGRSARVEFPFPAVVTADIVTMFSHFMNIFQTSYAR